MDIPGKDNRHQVKDGIVRYHDDGICDVKSYYVDAVARGVRIPIFGDRYALEYDTENAAKTKSYCNKFHESDGPDVIRNVGDAAIETKQSKFDKHVASQIEAKYWYGQLCPLAEIRKLCSLDNKPCLASEADRESLHGSSFQVRIS